MLETNEFKKKRLIGFSLNSLTKISFPWWCKIGAYLLSFLFIGVSIFFILIKGIEFGDAKVAKWLTSLLISFLTSVLLTQPVQVLLVSAFLVFIASDQQLDDNGNVVRIVDDPDDNGAPLSYHSYSDKTKHVHIKITVY